MIDDVFCKIINGQLKAEPVYRDDEFIVINDIKPAAPVHLLVIPVRHFETLGEMTAADAAMLGRMLLLAHRMGAEHAPKGYRIIINEGEHGGKLVPHFHMHVLGGKRLGAKLIA